MKTKKLHSMKLLLIAAAGFLVIQFWPRASSADELANAFIDLTMGFEEYLNTEVGDYKPIITKWTSPLKVRFLAANDRSISAVQNLHGLEEHVVGFSELLDGLQIQHEFVEDKNWNFVYFFYSDSAGLLDLKKLFESENKHGVFTNLIFAMERLAQREELDRGLGCLFLIRYHNDVEDVEVLGEIFQAFIILPTYGSAEDLKACFFEESIQALGIPNDYGIKEAPFETMFDDRTHVSSPTETDIKLLQILYDPLIKPGMNREEVLAVWPQIEAAQ